MTDLALPHKLTLTERKNLTLTGVTEVIAFDEATVLLATELGNLEIQGEQLSLKSLSIEGGQVTVTGEISGFFYAQPRQKKSFWERLTK